jgi:hypothetical protein
MKKPMMTTKELSEAGVTRIVMPENVPTVSEEYQRGYDMALDMASLVVLDYKWQKGSSNFKQGFMAGKIFSMKSKTPALLGGPFKDRQKVSLARWDKHSPPWDRMGECIVIGQRKTHGCESGWMVKVMAKDGTYREIDSHWLEQPNKKS